MSFVRHQAPDGPGGDLSPPKVFLTGLPGCGKTTVVERVAARFPGRAAGFVTREVREEGRRVGFEIVTLTGVRGLLSHVDFSGPQRVGRYGVDLEALHRVALPAMSPGEEADMMLIDEIGKMECLSSRFVEAMERLVAGSTPLLATVALQGEGFIREVKSRPGISLITVTPENRDGLVEELLRRFSGRRP